MPIDLDRRSRSGSDVRPTPASQFFTDDFIALAQCNGHLVAEGIRFLQAPPLAIIVDDSSWSVTANGEVLQVDAPSSMPPVNMIEKIEEPFFKASILTPTDYTGTIMELCQHRRGEMVRMDYISAERVEMVYRIPLAEVVVDFFDSLKSRTKGYASLDYEPDSYRESNLVKLDILLIGAPVDAFSSIIHRAKAEEFGRKMCAKLRELIPRQMFDVPIQAAIGGRIVARETVKARRKDVLAKCYGGDISRKRKLLDKQKEGKKKMKSIGRVEVPQEAFISALKLED